MGGEPGSAYFKSGDFAPTPLPPTPPTAVGVIESIATGAPAQIFSQADAAAQVAGLFSDPAQQARIPRIYQKTRVTTRHLAVNPIDPEFLSYSREVGTIRGRMNTFYDHAVPLAVDVAGRAIAHLEDPASEIGMLVFATSTGFIAPGVDVAVVKQLGLSPAINRLMVNFMGCAAAMNSVRAAVDFVRAHPDKKALVICLELSSVNAVFDDNVNDVIIHSLFGDGCGAVVIGASNPQQQLPAGAVVIRDSFSFLFDDAEDGIVLGVNDNGITCELSENLPQYILRGVDPVVTDVLARNGLTKSEIDAWAIHPGGPKIIEESARSLGLDPEQAAPSWDVLAEYGNMLSVSLIFVLEQLIAQQAGKPISTGVAFSFAPGVTLEGILFDIIRP
ncbi:type III polyketide synthase [Nocardia seriolae]|uniref:type III polyketide synthase n=1 Tax=Nocardia seriolae TaxID=37332 RepID=UPI001D16425A|nr:3-oxoacyl-[acyl-carrier-protein] synthase III C-terminal domain-containing protein [Nocardia seriolae]WNJ62943.1 3-oxoacyl-[acyl-carrier-protein] synthase III C-terminal domain-containing protein [Nocardia seriolae]